MKRSDKHFISKAFVAPNVLEIDVDPSLLAPCKAIVREIQDCPVTSGPVTFGGKLNLFVASPASWSSDIRWFSQNDPESFAWFEMLFEAIAPQRHVERMIDYDRRIVLYSGSFIARSRCTEPHFHKDWIKAENDAWVFLTPVSERCDRIGLVYENLRGGTSDYTYRHGKGLIFGDHFSHSTRPGSAREPEILLSLNFGTDRMDHWHQIATTTAYQGNCHRRPDGVFVRAGVPQVPDQPLA